MKHLGDIAWLLAWMLASTAWIVTATPEISTTFDETFYIKSGMSSWRTGSNRELMRAGTMPLPIHLQTLPAYLWEKYRGEQFNVEDGKDFHTVLPVARTMNLIFWWLLLGYGALLSRHFGGPWGGRFGICFLASEANLLGHACLATTDIAITAMVLVFTWHYLQSCQSTSWRSCAIPGILFGAALCAKASALMFVPIIMFAIELPKFWRDHMFTIRDRTLSWIVRWQKTSNFRSRFIKIFLIGSMVLWAYCGTDWKPQASFVRWADSQQGQSWFEPMAWLANHAKVFPNAGEGLVYQIKHNIKGHGSYLNGNWHPRAIWYYFPVALSVKVSSVVLLVLTICLTRPRSYITAVNLISLLLLLFSLNCRVQIGIRLVFPLLAFVMISASVTLANWLELWKMNSPGPVLGLLAAALLYPAWVAWPDGLRYANGLWGGPENVHLHLSDSNSDWGQGLIDLDRTTNRLGLPIAKVWYFGTDPTLHASSRSLPLHAVAPVIENEADVLNHLRGHVVAVSLTILYGEMQQHPQGKIAVRYLAKTQPIARSRSYYIYDFRSR